MSDYDKLKSQLLARYVAHRCCRHYKDLYSQCMALLAKIEELENANSDKSHLLARCFAEKKRLEAALRDIRDGNFINLTNPGEPQAIIMRREARAALKENDDGN